MPKSAPAHAGTLRRMPSEPTPQLRSQMRTICGTVRGAGTSLPSITM